MKPYNKILAGVLFLMGAVTATAQTAHVQYELKYNSTSGYYEAHAHVIGTSLISPGTIPSPSKFTVVVPAAVNNTAFSIAQNVNPPGLSWSNSNSVYAPSAAPGSDFHAFIISGGGGSNVYPAFTPGTDITLFKFAIPGLGYSGDVRLYDNATDPSSSAPGMNGIDFKQSFKTAGVDRYVPGSDVRISGFISYNGDPQLRMNGVTVQLLNSSNAVIGTTVSTSYNSQPGHYSFSYIPDGTGYKLTGSYGGLWGGNNSTDALIVQLNTIGTYPLSGLPQVVADVNASNTISALDALYIKMRTVSSISSYPAGNWKISEQTFNLSGTPVSKDLSALCVGDVNGSFNLTATKSAGSLSMVDDGVIMASAGEEFIYHLRSNHQADLGAMTLFMNYDPDRFEIMDVASDYAGIKYEIGKSIIAIAWADTKPLFLNSGDVVLSLKMRLKENLSEPSRIFNVMTGSEFADISARPYENFDLKMSAVVTPGTTEDLTMYNFPNPCAGATTIVYSLPQQGHVRLVMTDMYGKVISTLVNKDKTAGTQTVEVDPARMSLVPGVYLYKIVFNTGKETYEKVNKLVYTR